MNTTVLEPEASVVQPEIETPGLTRWSVLIAAGVFAFSMAQPQVLRLPFQNLLKNQLHVSRAAMASFFALSALAWYFKPIFGILTDSVPLFGSRRRSYLLLGALGAAVLYLLVGIVPRNFSALLWSVVLVNVMLVFVSTVTGGLTVQIGQRFGATGRLSSVFFFVQNACVLIVGPLGGYLASRAFGLTAVFGAVAAASVVPFAWWILREPRVTASSGKAWMDAKAQFKTLLRSKALWSAAGLIFLFNVMPGFNTPLYYYQTDTLGLSQQFIGTLILLGGGFGLLGTLLYGLLCRRLTLRWLLAACIVVGSLGTLGYLFYSSGRAAAIVESENGICAMLALLALIDLAVRSTPRGSEGLGFALMMSVQNGALALSDISGSWLIDHHHATFFKLVWLNAGTTALVLVLIPLLPGALIDRTDGSLCE